MSRFLRHERAVGEKKGNIIFNEGTLPFVECAYSFIFSGLIFLYLMDTSGEALSKCPVDLPVWVVTM